MIKKMVMLILIAGMLIGVEGCKEEDKLELNEPNFMTTFPPITKVEGGRNWEDIIQNMQDDESPPGAPAAAVPFVPAITDVKGPRHYELESPKEAAARVKRINDAVIQRYQDETLAEIAEAARKKRETRWVIDKPIFGIHLGETLDSLQSRLRVFPSGYTFEDKDYPGKIWGVSNSNPSVNLLHVRTFNGKIYLIEIQFTDGSKANYEAIKNQLEIKYKDTDDSLFGGLFGEVDLNSTIDNVKIRVKLNHDIGFMEDDKLELTYMHTSLFQQVRTEFLKRKSDKISNEL